MVKRTVLHIVETMQVHISIMEAIHTSVTLKKKLYMAKWL